MSCWLGVQKVTNILINNYILIYNISLKTEQILWNVNGSGQKSEVT
jgi:hypothetical protein